MFCPPPQKCGALPFFFRRDNEEKNSKQTNRKAFSARVKPQAKTLNKTLGSRQNPGTRWQSARHKHSQQWREPVVNTKPSRFTEQQGGSSPGRKDQLSTSRRGDRGNTRRGSLDRCWTEQGDTWTHQRSAKRGSRMKASTYDILTSSRNIGAPHRATRSYHGDTINNGHPFDAVHKPRRVCHTGRPNE